MCYPGFPAITLRELLVVQARWVVLRQPQAVVEGTAESGGGGPLKQFCLCSPTTHPGSFKCRHHHAEYVWGGRILREVK